MVGCWWVLVAFESSVEFSDPDGYPFIPWEALIFVTAAHFHLRLDWNVRDISLPSCSRHESPLVCDHKLQLPLPIPVAHLDLTSLRKLYADRRPPSL